MNERIKEIAEQAGLDEDVYTWNQIQLERFAELIRQDERETISNEYFMSLASDLENGVKWLNDKAHKYFGANYPELKKFNKWLVERSEK